jgi:hypothetical protein
VKRVVWGQAGRYTLLYYTCSVSFVLRAAQVICHVYRHNVVVTEPLFPRVHYFSAKIRTVRARGTGLPYYIKKVCAVRYGVSSQIKHLLLPLEQEECKFYRNYSLYCQGGNLHRYICIPLLFKTYFRAATKL